MLPKRRTRRRQLPKPHIINTGGGAPIQAFQFAQYQSLEILEDGTIQLTVIWLLKPGNTFDPATLDALIFEELELSVGATWMSPSSQGAAAPDSVILIYDMPPEAGYGNWRVNPEGTITVNGKVLAAQTGEIDTLP